VPWTRRSFANNALVALQRWTQPVVGLARTRTCTIDGQLYTFRWTAEAHRGREAETRQVLAALEGFAGEVARAGGRYAVVFAPSKLRVLGPLCSFPPGSTLRDPAHLGTLREAATEWAHRTGIPLVDVTAPLQAAARDGAIPWFWGDTHWNARGHEAVAAALAESEPVRAWLAAAR
jgi:hypothetical protein